jgi:hypothetical protein
LARGLRGKIARRAQAAEKHLFFGGLPLQAEAP